MVDKNKLLCNYALIRYYHIAGNDYLDVFKPFILSYLNGKDSLTANDFKAGLKADFGLNIPIHTLNTILQRLNKRAYLINISEKFKSTNKIFDGSDESISFHILSYLNRKGPVDQMNIKNDFKKSKGVSEEIVESCLKKLVDNGLLVIREKKFSLTNKSSNQYKDSYFLEIISCLKEANSYCTADYINKRLKSKYNTDIEIRKLRQILDLMRNMGYVVIDERKYELAPKGLKYVIEDTCNTINIVEDYEPLFSDLREYIKKNTGENKDINEIHELLLKFIYKNIAPSLKFLVPSESENNSYDLEGFDESINRKDEKHLCEYVNHIKNLDEKNEKYKYYNYIKDIILGTLIFIAVKSDNFPKNNENGEICEIFLDTNLLFYLLGLHFAEFVNPTKELFDILNKNNLFKIKVFDFTVDEASRVLNKCIYDIKNYMPNIRINAICSFFKNKKYMEDDIKLVVANLDEEINKLGVEILPTKMNVNNFDAENSEIFKSLRIDRPFRPLNSVKHDAMAIGMIEKIRNGHKKKIETSKAIFLTADQRLAEFAFNKLYKDVGETHKERGTIPEVLVDRLMTNILWLKNPSLNITLDSLVCTCARNMYINKTVWEAFIDVVNNLKNTNKLSESDITIYLFQDEIENTLGVYSEKQIDDIDNEMVSKYLKMEKSKKIVHFAKIQVRIFSIILIIIYIIFLVLSKDFDSFVIITGLICSFVALGLDKGPIQSIWIYIEKVIPHFLKGI